MTAQSGATVGRQLYGPNEIADAVERLARAMAADYRNRPLVLLGVLKGSLYFTVDLSRALAAIGGPSEIFVDYVCVVSYGSLGQARGQVRLLLDQSTSVEGRHVVIVEDLADNGLTLDFLRTRLKEQRPASLSTCVLFNKPSRRALAITLDYVGLTVPDTFVVGYGLDYQERYRSLPYLAELKYQGS